VNFKTSISYNLQSILGRKIKRKILVIESDDWGSIRMPSKKAYDNLKKAGIPVNKCPFNTFDALETAEDIFTLNNFCNRFKDINGNPLKITANFIMANPDFKKIKESNFEDYFFRDIVETYNYYQENDQTFKAIQASINDKTITPQLHGREHLQVNHWLSTLKSGDKETLLAFNNGLWGHPSSNLKKTGINFSSTFHISMESELNFAKKSVNEAALIFKETFGIDSETFIAPRYIWPEELESCFKQVGIKSLQGTLVQYRPKIGNSTNNLNKQINWMGRNNLYGLNYLTRNIFFEPAINQKYNWEANALNRIKTAFFWGKPAVISMHRLNFMGSFSNENRDKNFQKLNSLVSRIIQIWPDVEFFSSNELSNDLYTKINND
jgi:hypothetical protein